MANQKVTSFVKKVQPTGPQIPGTRASIHNSQILISSGISSFDNVIGGGLPVGSLVLIDEDTYGTFSKAFMKYFLAEGIASAQAIHLCSKDVNPESFINKLPGLVEAEVSDLNKEVKDEQMTIAWRYQNMKLVSSVASGKDFSHHFDLTKSIDPELLKRSDISYWSHDQCVDAKSFEESEFGLLLQSVRGRLESGRYRVSDTVKERSILRIGLLQIGSPLWSNYEKYLVAFLYCLRALVRNSCATCLITVPFHLFENKTIRAQCVHLSDICVQLESFAGTALEQNPALSDYNAFFRLVKWAAINSLVTGVSSTADLALKMRRRKMTIEKLHLPPELEDTTEREDHVGCGSAKSKLLEF